MLRAAVYYARTIGNMGRLDEALDCLRETTDRMAGASGSAARKWLASTLGVYAKMLADGGRQADAVAVYDAAVVVLDRPHTLEQREMVADALIAKGIILRDLGDREGAAAAFRSVFDRFGDDRGGRLPSLAAWSGFTAARLLHRYRDPVEMRELSQLLVERFEDSEDEEVQELVWRAGLNARGLAYRERILRALRLRYPRLRRDRE